jgi:hypothetical protein
VSLEFFPRNLGIPDGRDGLGAGRCAYDEAQKKSGREECDSHEKSLHLVSASASPRRPGRRGSATGDALS